MPPSRRSLSNLPENALEKILCDLPISDAVHTSILSTSWRNRWKSIPNLNLNLVGNIKASRIIRLHSAFPAGPIRCLKSFSDSPDSEADFWESVVLACGGPNSTLHTLDLSNFSISLKFIADLFPNLNHLKLDGRIVTAASPEFFSRFTALETLHLESISVELAQETDTPEQRMVFNAPKLRLLTLKFADMSFFDEVVIQESPDIQVAELNGTIGDGSDGISGHLRVKNVLEVLTKVEELKLSLLFFRYLANGNVPASLSTKFDHLRVLLLRMEFERMRQVFLLRSLLRSLPNLQELSIHGFHAGNGNGDEVGKDFWEEEGYFEKLETVQMYDVKCVNAQLSFIEFILAKAQSLKTIRVTGFLASADPKENPESVILEFPRMSDQAQILTSFEEIESEDESEDEDDDYISVDEDDMEGDDMEGDSESDSEGDDLED